MTQWKCVFAAAVALGFAPFAEIEAQQKSPGVSTLTDKDRADIKELSSAYGRALGNCAAEEYVGLFAPPDGYFASGPRGKVAGREKLIALLQSERHCNDGSERSARNLPSAITIEPSSGGATAQVTLATTAGHYEDVYIKTAKGWRFKGRTYISPQEKAAGLTSHDFDEIRRLGGNDTGQFQDVWLTTPEGKRFRSAGLVIAPSPEGATGRGYLSNDGGRYDDLYVKTPQGWRFRSRQFAPAGQASLPPASSTVPSNAVASAQSELPRIWTGVYTTAQAERGKAVFQATCMTCHNFDLKGNSGRGPALVGDAFMANWETESLTALFTRMKTTMPRNNPASLTEDVYLDLLAHILQSNTYPDGTAELKTASLSDLHILKRDGTGKRAVQNFAMVEMVGCLAQADNRWVLTHTSEPVATKDQPSSDAELKAAAVRPIGADTFRLVSAKGFDPASHQGQQIFVKGLLYRRPDDNRLNVTALQTLASRCPESR